MLVPALIVGSVAVLVGVLLFGGGGGGAGGKGGSEEAVDVKRGEWLGKKCR